MEAAMLNLRTTFAAALLSVAVFVSPAQAFHGGGFHGHGFFFHHHFFHRSFFHHPFFFFGGFFNPFPYSYAYPYPYPYPYANTYGYPAASPYPAGPAVTAQNVWYFCRSSNAYYPYVQKCPQPWEEVSPQPH